MTESMEIRAIRAQAHLHHAYFLGLLLTVSAAKPPEVVENWMFRLFRRQHLEKFLSSFEKLGLTGLPHAVACARYHVLSNNMGGVGVEYMEESDRKAWVRFRYPRWMYHGPTICGVPVEVSRGFLRGWYAYNGVSLNDPRLGFVCVSEDMTGEFGLCGYFYEYDHDLQAEDRLRFARTQLPPPFDPAQQPRPPADRWDTLRLEKANRNYAMEYVRNGLCELAQVVGVDEAQTFGGRTARLIGLQYFAETAAMVDAVDGDLRDAGDYLARMFAGMGDSVTLESDGRGITLQHAGLRIARGLDRAERALILHCWAELWNGAMRAQRQLKSLQFRTQDSGLVWQIAPLLSR